VKASLPKGASNTEIYNKTDQVLKEHHISWDSAAKGKTTDGSSYNKAKQDIYNELFPDKSTAKSATASGTTATATNTSATANSSSDPSVLTNWGTTNPNNWGDFLNQLINAEQKKGNSIYSGFNSYLNGKGTNTTNYGALASRTGNYVANMTGQQFLPNSLQYSA
jgi:hypothetical protein